MGRSKYANLGERLIANSVIGKVPTYADQPCWIWTGETNRNRSGMLLMEQREYLQLCELAP